MKKEVSTMLSNKGGNLVLAIIAMLAFFFYLESDRRAFSAKPLEKPTIYVKTINASPRVFFQVTRIMNPEESVIFRDYQEGTSTKWTSVYMYAYVLVDYRNRSFSRVKYLESHSQDAVDTKAIFSDQLPDPNIFNIIEKR